MCDYGDYFKISSSFIPANLRTNDNTYKVLEMLKIGQKIALGSVAQLVECHPRLQGWPI